MTETVYLDCHATTPLDPEVRGAMLPYLEEQYGNPASTTHAIGARAALAVDQSRQQIARLLDLPATGIIFTSGATEANNLALLGLAAARNAPGRVISAPTEHASILAPLRHLAERGWTVTLLPVDDGGRVDPEDLRRELRSPAALVTLMTANNEIGTVHPVRELAALTREQGVPFHTDAVQAAGWLPLQGLGADLLTLSGHKMHGPKGVGVLVRAGDGPCLKPLLYGGGQEGGLRPGTPNVAAIVGFGAACARAGTRAGEASERVRRLRDRLAAALLTLGGVTVHGAPEARLPNNLSLSIDGIHAEAALLATPTIAASTGAACAGSGHEASHVLRAIGLDADRIRSSFRFGLARRHTEADVDAAATALVASVLRLRALSQAPVSAS